MNGLSYSPHSLQPSQAASPWIAMGEENSLPGQEAVFEQEGRVQAAPFSLMGKCIDVCRARPGRIVFPDGEDIRAVSAAMRLEKEELAHVTLLGRPFVIHTLMRQELEQYGGLAMPLTVMDPAMPDLVEVNAAEYRALQQAQGKTVDEQEARKFAATGLAAAAFMIRRGEAEAGIGGNLSSTADMLRAGLRILGTAPGSKTISGFFFMLAPQSSHDSRKVLIFADSGVIPEPTLDQLVDIALDSAGQYGAMIGQEARVALLSFSSHGSAKHQRAAFIREAVEKIRQRDPALMVDGELQFDAAMIPEVAQQKVPDSPLQGEANVLIFPSLEAGNIGYKIAQRLGGYTALGPFLQGLNGGWHDLSRGCSAEDIYQAALVGTTLERGRRKP